MTPDPVSPLESGADAVLLETPRLGLRRVAFAAAVAATTVFASSTMAGIVSTGGTTRLELVILVLFVPTFAWISVAFWNALIGFALTITGRDPATLRKISRTGQATRFEPLRSVTALAIPARNEDVDAVVGRVERMLASLQATGHAASFDVHLLSDTTDPTAGAEEERAWSGLRARYPGPVGLHYRRRAVPHGRKAGNLWEFFERCRGRYRYAVVLDADSLMRGDALVRLVRTMDANPRAGLLQTVPVPAPSPSPTRFGRLVAFAGKVYGPLLASGQAFWQGDAANYWGHNAIVRVEAFLDHARLPVLAGSPPWGGEVLSHDFVEAALLRRAGWGVHVVPSVEGSWEDVPQNLVDFARRDRRWCQGSLQHLRLLALPGLHPLSRLHFLFGAMGYVSSVFWMLLLVAGTVYVAGWIRATDPGLSAVARLGAAAPLGGGASLLAVTAVVLFAPKLLGLVAAWEAREGFGGARPFLATAAAEAFFAVLAAPVSMLSHARSVGEIVAGRSVSWGSQPREGRWVSVAEALRFGAWMTAVGLVWGGWTFAMSPLFFAWMAPIFAGLLFAVPIVRWTSGPSRAVGTARGAHDSQTMILFHSGVAGVAPLWGGSVNEMHEAERALFELKRRRVLFVEATRTHADDRDVLAASAEGLEESALEALRGAAAGPLHLVVTSHRARALGLERGPGPVAVALPGNASPGDVLHLCTAPGSAAAQGPSVRPATDAEAQSLALARMGHMIPAVVTATVPERVPDALRDALASGRVLRIHTEEVRRALTVPRVAVTQVSEAPVPLRDAEDARFVLFREEHAMLEHVAILIGRPEGWPDPVPVRLHSACLTGDLFGSLKCDCGEQLRGSLTHFQQRGGGVLLYLQQEGRGIGLGNKLRAYALQDGGLDTVDADCTLGFGPDERSYDAALDMLHHLGVKRVQLLTNNPDKLRAIERGGVQVIERMPLHGKLNRYNLPYVKAKVQRAGHWLGDMLGEASGRGS